MEGAEPFLAVKMSVMWELSGTVHIYYGLIQLFTWTTENNTLEGNQKDSVMRLAEFDILLMNIKLRENLQSRDVYLWVARDLSGKRKAHYLLLLFIGLFEGQQLVELFSAGNMFLSLPKWNIKLWEGKGVQQFFVKNCWKLACAQEASFMQLFK